MCGPNIAYISTCQIFHETVKHYLLDCLKYQHYQENLIDFANKNNGKLTIESILKNRDMFPLIYDYVLKTKKEI